MRKSNIWSLVIFILALFFFFGIDVHASSIDYNPSYVVDSLKSSSTTGSDKVYHFYLGTDEIVLSSDNTAYSVVGDSAVVSFEFQTVSTTLPIGDYLGGYDYYNLSITPYHFSNLTYTDSGNGLNSIIQNLTYTRPFVIIDGEKQYLVNSKQSTIALTNITDDTSLVFGIEVSFNVNYSALNTDSYSSYFGWSTYSCTGISYDIELNGVKYTSTGEEAIVDSVISWGGIQYNAINSMKESLKTAILNLQGAITTKMQSLHDSLMLTLYDINLWLSDIWNEICFGFDGVLTKLDELIETLSRGYDSSDTNKINVELDSALSDYSNEEQLVFSDAKVEMSSYDFSDVFDFSAPMVSSLSLITTFANSFFISSGDLSSGLIVMMALVFVSIIIGLIRFVRD